MDLTREVKNDYGDIAASDTILPAAGAEGPHMSTRQSVIRLGVYTLLLFASWHFNLLGVPDAVHWSRSEPRLNFVGSESHLVMYRLERLDVPHFHPLFCESPKGPQPYKSQFGGQGVILAAVCRWSGDDPASFAVVAAAAFSLLTSVVVAVMFVAAQRRLGPPVGDVACALAAFAPVFVKFAPSLYWTPYLLIAPFALVWCLGANAITIRRRMALAVGVGMAVCCKALCGYEYITTVMMAPLAAAWFHQHRAGEPLGRKIVAAGTLLAAGLGGFALAMAVHVAQIEATLGEDGVAAIRDRAAARTTGAIGNEIAGEGSSTDAGFVTKCFGEYFDQRALGAPALLTFMGDVSLRVLVAATVAFVAMAMIFRKPLGRDATALAGALLLALVAGISWQVLAINHMCVHRHLNLIVFAAPFLPLAFITAGYTARCLGRGTGLVALGVTAIIMLVNLAWSHQLAESEASDQRRAEAAVVDRIRAPLPIADPRAVGCLDQAGPASAIAPGLLLDWGLLDANTAGPTDPDAIVMTGWASSDWKSTTRPSARIVVACGGRIVTSRIQWYRRSDLDTFAGKPIRHTGFVMVVPSCERKRGEPFRVFVTAVADPEWMTELRVPGIREVSSRDVTSP